VTTVLLEPRTQHRVLASIVIAAASCTGPDAAQSPTVSTSSVPGVRAQPNGVTRTMVLEAGEHETYLVRALDPPTHSFEVRLVVKPRADLRLWFVTPYGQRLDLVRSSTTDEGCVTGTKWIVCLQEFPALEAQHGGDWALHVRNASGRSVTSEITVTFTPV